MRNMKIEGLMRGHQTTMMSVGESHVMTVTRVGLSGTVAVVMDLVMAPVTGAGMEGTLKVPPACLLRGS